MSFYNMLFGVNSAAPMLLSCLGFTKDDIPRFRDCAIEGNNIVIHTRTGGGNRDYYESEECCRINYPDYFNGVANPSGPWNSTLANNAFFLRDQDDDYDCTYANFYFRFPDEYAADLTALAERSETYKPSDKWQALLKAMEKTK